MSKIDDGDPAFPSPAAGNISSVYGMSTRDYFAAQIACGMAAFSGTSGMGYGPAEIAGRSYQVADAMLRARQEQSS